MSENTNIIKRFWNGDEPLWRAFWIWGVLGNTFFVLFFFWFPNLTESLLAQFWEMFSHFKATFNDWLIINLIISGFYLSFTCIGIIRYAKKIKSFSALILAAMLTGYVAFLWLKGIFYLSPVAAMIRFDL